MPEAPRRRAQVQAFALAIAADLQPLQNTGTLNYLRDTVGVDDDGRALWLRHFLERGLAALETEAAARPSTPFVFGDAPTLADDRKSVASGKSLSERVDPGRRRVLKKKQQT